MEETGNLRILSMGTKQNLETLSEGNENPRNESVKGFEQEISINEKYEKWEDICAKVQQISHSSNLGLNKIAKYLFHESFGKIIKANPYFFPKAENEIITKPKKEKLLENIGSFLDISQKVDKVFHKLFTPFFNYIQSEEYKELKDEKLKKSLGRLEHRFSARSTKENDFPNYWNSINKIRKKIVSKDFGFQDVQNAAEIMFNYIGTINDLSFWMFCVSSEKDLYIQLLEIYEKYSERKNLIDFALS